MSRLIDLAIARLIATHVRLLACQARLAEDVDPEALHDLRTSTRRLRSLLRPLRGAPGVEVLESAARDLGQLTTPLRDMEVLACELGREYPALAGRRREALEGIYLQVAESRELARMLAILDKLPGFLRGAQAEGLLGDLHQEAEKRLRKQVKKLRNAMDDPAHDRHRLRLLIKRVRYAGEAWPELLKVSPSLYKSLRRAQGSLGDWHDHWQWLVRAAGEADLAPCVAAWHISANEAEARSDGDLERLRRAL